MKILVDGKPRVISSVFDNTGRDITGEFLKNMIETVTIYNSVNQANRRDLLDMHLIGHKIPPSEVMNDIAFDKNHYLMLEDAFKWWEAYALKHNEVSALEERITLDIRNKNNYFLKIFDFDSVDINGVTNYKCELLRSYAETEKIDISDIKKTPYLPEKSVWEEMMKMRNEKEFKEEKTVTKAKYTDKQVAMLGKFIRAGYDIEAVKNPELNENQLKELYLGRKSGLDISLYTSPKISAEEMKELRRSAAKGVDLRSFAEAVIKTGEYTKEQTLQILDAAKHGVSYKNMLNPELNHLQMRQIKLGERYGLDTSVYASADFSAEQMQQLRLELIVRKVMESIKNFFRESWEKICKWAAEQKIPEEEAATINEAVMASSERGLADKLFSEATLIIVSSKISDKIVDRVLNAEKGLEEEAILNSMEMAETVSEELAAEADEEAEMKEKETENENEATSEAECKWENDFGDPPPEEEAFEMEEVI